MSSEAEVHFHQPGAGLSLHLKQSLWGVEKDFCKFINTDRHTERQSQKIPGVGKYAVANLLFHV